MTISIPLGNNRINTYWSKRGASEQLGSSWSSSINDALSYSVSTSRDQNTGKSSFSGSLNATPRYTQLGLGFSQYSYGQSTSGSLRGGMVAHAGGLTFSPYSISDTFGILSTGDQTGIGFNTPGGRVWTDAWGNAVIPNLPPYRKGQITIDGQSLPTNIEYGNGIKSITAARGAVPIVGFELQTVQRWLFNIKTTDGQVLPTGSTLTNQHDELLGISTESGQVFITNANADDILTATLPDKCQAPCDHIPIRSWPLFKAREVLHSIVNDITRSPKA